MNWLALSPAEVAAVWAALAALALWLYLHHRRPMRRRVSTLRFWASVQPVAQPRRRRLREPWALLAQVLFLLLLILALANPRWGVTFEGRSVVIVLDTSIWSQVRPAGESPWIDREREEALRLLDSLPPGDRVLLLPAEADAPPILPFTTDRAALRRAIARSATFQRHRGYSARARNGQSALAGSQTRTACLRRSRNARRAADAQPRRVSRRPSKPLVATATSLNFWSGWWAVKRPSRTAESRAFLCGATRRSPIAGICSRN